MAEFLLIRHALTDAADRWYAGRMAGVSLNDLGRQQAKDLARFLANVTVDAIYSSPLDRCLETAGEIARSQDIEVKVEQDFVEIDCGAWTGKTFDELRQDDSFHAFNSFRCGTRPPEGELMVEVQARMIAGLLRLVPRHSRDTVAIVTHSDAIKSVLAYFLGMPLDLAQRLRTDPASVSILELWDDDARVKVVNYRGPLGMLEL